MSSICRISQLSKQTVADGSPKGKDNRLVTKHCFEVRGKKTKNQQLVRRLVRKVE